MGARARGLDLALLSHVTRNEGAAMSRTLLRKARAALALGGRVIVHDFMAVATGTAPLFASLFSARVATYTESGRAYGAATYKTWLRRAGFALELDLPICAGAPNASRALVGRR